MDGLDQDVANEVSRKRRKRWQQYWIPYAELSEEGKEADLVWARKILEVLSDIDVIPEK